jgi:hypothetical protein
VQGRVRRARARRGQRRAYSRRHRRCRARRWPRPRLTVHACLPLPPPPHPFSSMSCLRPSRSPSAPTPTAPCPRASPRCRPTWQRPPGLPSWTSARAAWRRCRSSTRCSRESLPGQAPRRGGRRGAGPCEGPAENLGPGTRQHCSGLSCQGSPAAGAGITGALQRARPPLLTHPPTHPPTPRGPLQLPQRLVQ